MQMLEHIGLLCMQKILKLFISTVFRVEHVPEKIDKTFGHINRFRIQKSNSIMCRYACVGFIDFMFADKTLNDYASLFSSYDFLKNDNKIFDYFKNE